MGERYGSSVLSSLSKSEMVAIMVDSHNMRGAASEPVDNEILLSHMYCFRLHSKRLQLYRNFTIRQTKPKNH